MGGGGVFGFVTDTALQGKYVCARRVLVRDMLPLQVSHRSKPAQECFQIANHFYRYHLVRPAGDQGVEVWKYQRWMIRPRQLCRSTSNMIGPAKSVPEPGE